MQSRCWSKNHFHDINRFTLSSTGPPRKHQEGLADHSVGSDLASLGQFPNQRPASDLNEMKYPTTPDDRYFVHKERLWRCTNPNLSDACRKDLVSKLMKARRAVRKAKSSNDEAALASARSDVNVAKVALGERGPTWWDDDTDYNRFLVKNTPYAKWWSEQLDS